MTKMTNSQAEIVKFGAEDVMTASLFVDLEEGDIPVLWLDTQSVINYNNLNKSDYNLYYLKDYQYQAYSGSFMLNQASMPSSVYTTARSSNEKPQNLNRMAAGDEAKYYLILDWLQAHHQGDNPFYDM